MPDAARCEPFDVFRVLRAIMASDLPPALRHFLLTLAALADGETGRGFHSQATIARAMGCSARMVRTYLAMLAATAGPPVAVVRRRRGTPEGRGRSSDEWQITLCDSELNRKSGSASGEVSTGNPLPVKSLPTGTELPLEPASTGNPLPVELGHSDARAGAQPEVCDGSTGSLRQLNRKPASGDLLLDPTLYPQERESTPALTLTNPKSERGSKRRQGNTSRRVPKSWNPTDAHRELARAEGVDFEHELRRFRNHEFSRAHSDWNRTFENWLLSEHARKLGHPQPASRSQPVQNGAHYRAQQLPPYAKI